LFQQEKKEIHDAVQPWGIRNLTDFLRHAQNRLKRLLLVLLPAGQSCQISATRHVGYLPLLLLAAQVS
jgi:hypothetical protein